MKLPKSMPEGESRDPLQDKISKLDIIAEEIKEALDMMEEWVTRSFSDWK